MQLNRMGYRHLQRSDLRHQLAVCGSFTGLGKRSSTRDMGQPFGLTAATNANQQPSLIYQPLRRSHRNTARLGDPAAALLAGHRDLKRDETRAGTTFSNSGAGPEAAVENRQLRLTNIVHGADMKGGFRHHQQVGAD